MGCMDIGEGERVREPQCLELDSMTGRPGERICVCATHAGGYGCGKSLRMGRTTTDLRPL